MGKKLFVGNLSYNTTSEDLQGLFSSVGTCESATVVNDRATGRSRGFGFVEMSSPQEARQAVEQINGREFQGRTLKVDEATERNDSRGGGGGGRGGFGGGGGGGGFGDRGGRGGAGGGGRRRF